MKNVWTLGGGEGEAEKSPNVDETRDYISDLLARNYEIMSRYIGIDKFVPGDVSAILAPPVLISASGFSGIGFR